MKIVFSGDRKSKTIWLAWKLRKIFSKNFIEIMLWDGYPSCVFIKR